MNSREVATPPKANVKRTMKGLRQIVRKFSTFIDRSGSDTAGFLLNLEVLCKYCHKANSGSASLIAI